MSVNCSAAAWLSVDQRSSFARVWCKPHPNNGSSLCGLHLHGMLQSVEGMHLALGCYRFWLHMSDLENSIEAKPWRGKVLIQPYRVRV